MSMLHIMGIGTIRRPNMRLQGPDHVSVNIHPLIYQTILFGLASHNPTYMLQKI